MMKTLIMKKEEKTVTELEWLVKKDILMLDLGVLITFFVSLTTTSFTSMIGCLLVIGLFGYLSSKKEDFLRKSKRMRR